MLKRNIDIKKINKFSENCMVGNLGIEITEIGKDYIQGKMPVDKRTTQPFGLLHGGASVALSETLGSFGAELINNENDNIIVGVEINANHIKSVKEGFVYGKSKPIHIGNKTQVWQTKITNDSGKLICISRLTLAVLEKK
tara:strand:+ start:91 stop:510 length:420 start_codon:yes stop_codon:yes gene_type:complete